MLYVLGKLMVTLEPAGTGVVFQAVAKPWGENSRVRKIV